MAKESNELVLPMRGSLHFNTEFLLLTAALENNKFLGGIKEKVKAMSGILSCKLFQPKTGPINNNASPNAKLVTYAVQKFFPRGKKAVTNSLGCKKINSQSFQGLPLLSA